MLAAQTGQSLGSFHVTLTVLGRRSQWSPISSAYSQTLEYECFRPTGAGELFMETLIHRLQGDLDTCWCGYKGLLLHEGRQGAQPCTSVSPQAYPEPNLQHKAISSLLSLKPLDMEEHPAFLDCNVYLNEALARDVKFQSQTLSIGCKIPRHPS